MMSEKPNTPKNNKSSKEHEGFGKTERVPASSEPEERTTDGRFKKGNTYGFNQGNKAGRGRPPSLTYILHKRLREQGDGTKESGIKIAEDLIEETINQAKDGSFKHLREIWVRLDGKGDLLPDFEVKEDVNSPEEHKEAAVKLYRAIIADEKSSITNKLKAQEQLNMLLGLTEPQSTPVEAARAIQNAAAAIFGASYISKIQEENEEEQDSSDELEEDSQE
jgi:hypothetical protein